MYNIKKAEEVLKMPAIISVFVFAAMKILIYITERICVELSVFLDHYTLLITIAAFFTVLLIRKAGRKKAAVVFVILTLVPAVYNTAGQFIAKRDWEVTSAHVDDIIPHEYESLYGTFTDSQGVVWNDAYFCYSGSILWDDFFRDDESPYNKLIGNDILVFYDPESFKASNSSPVYYYVNDSEIYCFVIAKTAVSIALFIASVVYLVIAFKCEAKEYAYYVRKQAYICAVIALSLIFLCIGTYDLFVEKRDWVVTEARITRFLLSSGSSYVLGSLRDTDGAFHQNVPIYRMEYKNVFYDYEKFGMGKTVRIIYDPDKEIPDIGNADYETLPDRSDRYAYSILRIVIPAICFTAAVVLLTVYKKRLRLRETFRQPEEKNKINEQRDLK